MARVGPIQSVQGGIGRSPGVGFVLHDDNDPPIAKFGFVKREDANVAAKLMSEIIATAEEVMVAPQ